MNIKTKLTLTIGILVAMIVLLVALSVVNLQILTATDPDSPAAGPGLQRALLWISIVGAACICVGIGIWLRLPASINKPIKEITNGIQEIANHNYEKRLDLMAIRNLLKYQRTSTGWPNGWKSIMPALFPK